MTKLLFMRISFWWSPVAWTFFQTDITETFRSPTLTTVLKARLFSSLNPSTMARLANLNGVSETLAGILKLPRLRGTLKRARIVGFQCKKKDDSQEHNVQTTRRLVLGLASIALVGHTCNGVSLAEDNGFWITGPLPVPSVDNNIANDKTGTRSFLKKGIYMADIGTKNRRYRLRKYAFDLLAMEDLIGKETLNYVLKYLRLKSTFMYYDFDKVITAATVEDNQPLTDLANRLFDNFEKLEGATKQGNLPQTETFYKDTNVILQEVMDRMA